MRQHIKEEPPDPREFRQDIPEPVVHLIARMMAKNPEERYSSTHELFEDIELVRMGQDPAGDQPEAGKATVLRAFNIEKARLERQQAEIAELTARVSFYRWGFWIAAVAAALLLAGLIVALATAAT